MPPRARQDKFPTAIGRDARATRAPAGLTGGVVYHISSYNEMMHTPLRDVLAVTKALSDRQRIRILALLQEGELCVCQVVAVLQLATSTISKHLSVLAAAGLVSMRKDGRWAYYRVAAGEPALRWLRTALAGDPALRADHAALTAIKKQNLEVLCRQQRPS